MSAEKSVKVRILRITEVVAVILGLVLIAYELRQNTNAVRSASHLDLLGLSFAIRQPVVEDEELAALVVTASRGGDFSPVDEKRYGVHISRCFDVWEQAYMQRQRGMIEENIWNVWDRAYSEMLATEGARTYWRGTRCHYTSSFADHVESNLFANQSLQPRRCT